MSSVPARSVCLRSTGTLGQLREDFAAIPALLEEPLPVPIGAVAPAAAAPPARAEPPQINLFE